MKPSGRIGPRGEAVTVAFVDWTYRRADGASAEVPAPTSVLNSRAAAPLLARTPEGREVPVTRDIRAEADQHLRLMNIAHFRNELATLTLGSGAAHIATALHPGSQKTSSSTSSVRRRSR